MKIVSQRDFPASPEELWAIIAQPGNMPAWNHKCVRADTTESLSIGERFSALYEMKGQQHPADGEIIACIPNREIAFRYELNDTAKTGTIIESLRIAPQRGSKTQLKHTVDFRHSNLPFWVKILIGFVGRFGKSVGGEPLQGVQDLLEATSRS